MSRALVNSELTLTDWESLDLADSATRDNDYVIGLLQRNLAHLPGITNADLEKLEDLVWDAINEVRVDVLSRRVDAASKVV